jgi:hypothetical protein
MDFDDDSTQPPIEYGYGLVGDTLNPLRRLAIIDSSVTPGD